MNETEKKILQGARECLLQEGHMRATVKRIAEHAGVNHGLIHHYFGSKEGLIVALIEQTQQSVMSGFPLESAQGQTPLRREERLGRFLELVRSHIMGNELMLEVIAMSSTSPEIASKLREVLLSRREFLQQLLGLSQTEAALLISIVLGTFVQAQIDPEISVNSLLEQARMFYRNPTSK
jgi:AcrR family transcriptional regulator